MLALVLITPFLGWGFLLHVSLASGFGAFLLARPWKAKTPAASIESPATAEAATALS